MFSRIPVHDNKYDFYKGIKTSGLKRWKGCFQFGDGITFRGLKGGGVKAIIMVPWGIHRINPLPLHSDLTGGTQIRLIGKYFIKN